jgi:hypothetical protein
MLNGLSSPAATIAHPAELRAHKTDFHIGVIETPGRSSHDKGGTQCNRADCASIAQV